MLNKERLGVGQAPQQRKKVNTEKPHNKEIKVKKPVDEGINPPRGYTPSASCQKQGSDTVKGSACSWENGLKRPKLTRNVDREKLWWRSTPDNTGEEMPRPHTGSKESERNYSKVQCLEHSESHGLWAKPYKGSSPPYPELPETSQGPGTNPWLSRAISWAEPMGKEAAQLAPPSHKAAAIARMLRREPFY